MAFCDNVWVHFLQFFSVECFVAHTLNIFSATGTNHEVSSPSYFRRFAFISVISSDLTVHTFFITSDQLKQNLPLDFFRVKVTNADTFTAL